MYSKVQAGSFFYHENAINRETNSKKQERSSTFCTEIK
jgi:hypothetical protein